MEGPYRDLGSGFARLAGAEGARRSPLQLRSIEDALYELLRNSRDAGAATICVASSLHNRRYRHLVVIDDGSGIPDSHKHLVFEPGVTTRHLEPVHDGSSSPHGAGLSLYHIKNAALVAEVLSASSPTAIKSVFDTQVLSEKSLQSGTRPSNTNLLATLANFASQTKTDHIYHGSPASILARLLENRIIQLPQRGSEKRTNTKIIEQVWEEASRLGLELSSRTIRRVLSGEVLAAREVISGRGGERGRLKETGRNGTTGPILHVEAEDLAEISAVLRRVARSNYLDLSEIKLQRRPGEVVLRALVYEPEEEYE